MFLRATISKDTCTWVEVRCLRYAVVYDLGHGCMSTVASDVKSLCLNRSGIHGFPSHVIFGQLGVRDGVGLVCDGIAGRRAIDGILQTNALARNELGFPRREMITYRSLNQFIVWDMSRVELLMRESY